MNFKKFISGVSAFAIAASAFAAMAVTASAYSVSLSADVTVAGYKDATFYNFQTNSPEVLPTSGDLRYREGGAYGLHNFGSGARSATVSISAKENDILLIETYNTNGQAVSASINCGTANAAVTTSSGYTAFDIASDVESVTFTVNRYTGIMGAVVLNKDTAAATADYTVKYVDEGGIEIKDSTTGNGVVGATVPVDKASFVAEGGQKYIYVEDNSASNAIDASGSTVVTVTYRAAAEYSYSVVADQGNVSIASGTAFEGDTVKVAYPNYINVDGTLYVRPKQSNNEFNYSFTLDEDNKVVTLDYTATTIENVVYLSEGEDIPGLTASNANNTKIRSSKSGSGYAAEDTTITNLPAGKYVIYAVLFAASSGGADLDFTLGDDNEFTLSSGNSNWTAVNTNELTISEATDLVMKAGGGNNAALDYIYVVKTGDYVAPATPSAEVTNTVATTYSGDQYDGEATSALVTVEYANMLADKTITLDYNGTTKTVSGATGFTDAGSIVVGVVIEGSAVSNPVFTAGVE